MSTRSFHGYNFEPNLKNIVGSNIKFLREKNNITQAELAEALDIKTTTLSGYELGASTPRLALAVHIAKYFMVDLNEFVSVQLDDEFKSKVDSDIVEYAFDDKEYKKYTNKQFWIYHYRTSTKFPATINSGIIEIRPHKARKINVVEAYFSNTDFEYHGHLILNSKHAYIYLRGSHGDRALIILNNPDSTKTYRGGIGMIISTSEGREKSFPCCQQIVLSETEIPLEKYDILIKYLSIKGSGNNLIKIDKSLDKEFFKLFLDHAR